jgi:hypothetical protein
VAGLLPGLKSGSEPAGIRRNLIVRIANKLSGIELSDWTGDRERLGTFWQEQPIVLVFIRHFG